MIVVVIVIVRSHDDVVVLSPRDDVRYCRLFHSLMIGCDQDKNW